MTLVTVDSSIFGFLWFLVITEIGMSIPLVFLAIVYVKVGRHGRAFFWAWAKHAQIVEEYGADNKVRVRLVKGDGVTLRDDKARKTWRPNPDSKYNTVDGISVFPSFAPSYSTFSPKVLASIQKLQPEDREALSRAIDTTVMKLRVSMKPVDVPIVDSSGKVIRTEKMYVPDSPAGQTADPGEGLSEIPVDGEGGVMLSPRQIYDWLLTAASPYDLNLVLNNGIALGQDMERKRHNSEVMKFVGLGLFILFAMVGIYILLKGLHLA